MEKSISKALGKTRGSQVVGSTPADPTTGRTGPAAAKIFKTLWTLKKNGYSEDTLKAKGHRLSIWPSMQILTIQKLSKGT